MKKKEETLYGWGTRTDKEPKILQWKTTGDNDTHPHYKGFVSDGKPSGLGVLTYPDGRKYLGKWSSGNFHGDATYIFFDGGRYVGDFLVGEVFFGTKYDKDGNILGKFEGGKFVEDENLKEERRRIEMRMMSRCFIDYWLVFVGGVIVLSIFHSQSLQ